MRKNKRSNDELREINVETHFTKYAEGSCLISYGDTKVVCTASIDETVPLFLRNKNQGWVTAEYNMLPRSAHQRIRRDAQIGKISGRTYEIQRLISRSLRSVIDLKLLGSRQIVIDCDVIQADGGTRTASITGGYIAMHLACNHLLNKNIIKKMPIKTEVAAISCGILKNEVIVDLDFHEDSNADVDSNFVISGEGEIVEIQCTAEKVTFNEKQFNQMLSLAKASISDLLKLQRQILFQ